MARSKFALPVQFSFLIFNGVGLFFGVVYNANTPDLYVHNAHHSIGWVATWIMSAQVIASLLFAYSRRGKSAASEQVAFLPISAANLAQHTSEPFSEYRWSGHGRQGSSDSSTLNGRDDSPTATPGRRNTFDDFEKPEPETDNDDDEIEMPQERRTSKSCWARMYRIRSLDKFLSARVPGLLTGKLLRITNIVYNVVDRLILVLSFIALVTGFITYCGLFVSAVQLASNWAQAALVGCKR
jgi:hypothetical protein